MLRHSGQAAIEVGQAVHRVCVVLLTLIVLLSIGAIGFAWRLSRGPLELDFVKARVEAEADATLVAPATSPDGTDCTIFCGSSRGAPPIACARRRYGTRPCGG